MITLQKKVCFHSLYIWKFLTGNTSNNIKACQPIQNANQGTYSRAVRGFAEKKFQKNIPKKSLEKNLGVSKIKY